MRGRIAGGRVRGMSDGLVERDGVLGVVLGPEEEAELLRLEAEIPELDRLGQLRPVEELIDELRAIGQIADR